MNRPVLFSALMAFAAITGSTASAQALCVGDNGTLSLGRDVPPEDNSFVSSSPASADAEFKLEVDLSNGLDIFSGDTEEEDTSAEADAPMIDESAAQETSEDVARSTTVEDLETGSRSASDLDTLELEPQPAVSRADYLSSRASEINSCR
ncbi:MAG: hypothetical protein AAF722_13120 [Cyanobacteria bacterium P01_C01_bin.70]